jgi:Phosphotransferase enzyme family
VNWAAEVRLWIELHVDVTGEIEERHVRPWSTVLWVPTTGEPVWFKESRDGFAHEAALLELIRPLAPDVVTDVIATRPEEGWLLMRDAGERARERPADWGDVLERYALLQLAAAPLVDELLSIGIFDLRWPALVRRFDDLVETIGAETGGRLSQRLPEILERLAMLETSPLGVTLDHGDLHDANVFVRDGHARILDWGDANVAHPFNSLAVEMDPASRGRYIAPFAALAPIDEVRREAELVAEHQVLLRCVEELRAVPSRPEWAETIDGLVAGFLDRY